MSCVNKMVLIIFMIAILLFTPIIPITDHETDHVTTITNQCLFDWSYDNYICPMFID